MTECSMTIRWRELMAGRRTLLAAVLGVAFNTLPLYTASVFINALHLDRGWTLSGLSFGLTLFMVVMAICTPAMASIFDRFDVRRVVLPGLLLQVAGFLILTRIDSLTGYWLAMAVAAVLSSVSSAPVYMRIVNRTFDVSKGTALALAVTGAGVFSALVPPALQAVVADSGWRWGYASVATVVLCGTPVIFVLLKNYRERPEPNRDAQAAPLTDFRYRTLFTSSTFLQISLGIFIVAVACTGLLVHFAPMLTRGGFTAQEAAWMISVIGVTQVVSRLATGALIDNFFAPRVAASIMAISSLGIALLFWGGTDWAVVGAIAVGMAYGAEVDLGGYFAGRYFPAHHFGKIFGATYGIFLTGIAISPSLYGLVVDQFGTYKPAIAGASILLLIAAGLFLKLPTFPTATPR